MLTIHKFKLEGLSGDCNVDGLLNVLSIQEQDGVLTAWCLLDTDSEYKNGFKWQVHGTGWEMKGKDLLDFHYKSTVMTKQGFVWHVFIRLYGG